MFRKKSLFRKKKVPGILEKNHKTLKLEFYYLELVQVSKNYLLSNFSIYFSVPSVSSSDTALIAAQKMRDLKVSSVVVMDEDTLQGIIT
jgi:CBS domain-containing protein